MNFIRINTRAVNLIKNSVISNPNKYGQLVTIEFIGPDVILSILSQEYPNFNLIPVAAI